MQFKVTYAFLGNPTSALIEGTTPEAARADFERQHPQIRAISGVEPVLEKKAYLSPFPTLSEDLSQFVDALLADPGLHVFTDAPERLCASLESAYQRATGLTILWPRVLEGSVAALPAQNGGRRAARAIFSYSANIPTPALACARPGYCASLPLLWTLIDRGFRL